MKHYETIKSWLVISLLAVFISACATSQDIIEDGPPDDSQTQMTDSGGTVDDGSGGAAVSGIDASGTDDGTAIVDDGMPKNAIEVLEQTTGPMSNRTIYFEYDSARLTSESIALLETHGNFVAGNGEVSLRLEGHADERGSREYNIALGDRRAQSVRRVLLFQGAAVDQIETVSYGEEQPAVSGHNEEAWSRNRRVELIYTVN